MTWIHAEIKQPDNSTLIHVKMKSACCALRDLFYVEVTPNNFIHFDTGLPIDEGMARTIVDIRRHSR